MPTRRPNELDLSQYWLDVPIEMMRDHFEEAMGIVRAGETQLRRRHPTSHRRWRRWRVWWTIQLAEINGRWRVAADRLRELLRDVGVRGTERMSAYATFLRVQSHLNEGTTPERIRVLRAALRLGISCPDSTLRDVLSEMDRLGLLKPSEASRAAFAFLRRLDKGLERPPRSSRQMHRRVLVWRHQGLCS